MMHYISQRGNRFLSFGLAALCPSNRCYAPVTILIQKIIIHCGFFFHRRENKHVCDLEENSELDISLK